MLRLLFILILVIVGLRCSKRPYQPNYNNHVSHNDVVKSRDKIVLKQAEREIRRSNLQRKRARKERSARHLNKKANKYSRKLVK